MKKLILPLVAVLFMAGTTPAQAQVERYTLEKPHSQIIFGVNHLGFTHSYGKFNDFDGHFTFDRTQPQNSSVEVTIHTAGIDMAHEKWNEHLKSADFFNVEQFPDMTFKSTKVEVTGDNTANITGDLTLLGQTHPVTLAAVMNKAAKHPMADEYHAGFSATTTLKRSEWGMSYGLPMVGDEVALNIQVDGIREELGGDGVKNQ